MKTVFNILLAAICALSVAGCAHTHTVEGPQGAAAIPAGVRVGIGGKEITEGERVGVYESVCKKVFRNRVGHMNQCNNKKIGEAVVLKILDHDSAVVQPQGELKMNSSMTVEKL